MTVDTGVSVQVKIAEHVLTQHKVAIKILNKRKIKQQDMEEKGEHRLYNRPVDKPFLVFLLYSTVQLSSTLRHSVVVPILLT